MKLASIASIAVAVASLVNATPSGFDKRNEISSGIPSYNNGNSGNNNGGSGSNSGGNFRQHGGQPGHSNDDKDSGHGSGGGKGESGHSDNGSGYDSGHNSGDSGSNSGSNNGYSDNNKKCLSKSEASRFVAEFASVWFQTAGDWEAVAVRIATPDFKFVSGGGRSLGNRSIPTNSPPVAYTSRAEWITAIGSFNHPTDLQTQSIDQSGCNTIWWQYRGKIGSSTVNFIERFDLKYTQERWKTYRSDAEFDSLAYSRGDDGDNFEKRDLSDYRNGGHGNNGDHGSNGKCINKYEATAFIKEFEIFWLKLVPNWESLAPKVVTRDFTATSGAILALGGQKVLKNGKAVVFNNRAELVSGVKRNNSPTNSKTTHIDVSGCNTVYWHNHALSNGLTVLFIKRFELRYVKGKWLAKSMETEFDAAAFLGKRPSAVHKRDTISSGAPGYINGDSSHNSGNPGHHNEDSEHNDNLDSSYKIGKDSGHSSNDKCISKTDAAAFVEEFSTVLSHNTKDWEAVARKVITPDFRRTSGSIRSVHYDPVYDGGDATAHGSREAFIKELKVLPPFIDLDTEDVSVSGCSSIFWQFRRQGKDGRAISGIERLNVRYSKEGNWATYWSQTEFDSCAATGGCKTISNNDDHKSNGKCISKSEAAAFVEKFKTVWYHDAPGWEAVARKLMTPDFRLVSGTLHSLHLEPVYGNGDATVHPNRETFITELEKLGPTIDLVTEDVSVSGCGTIFWQLRRQSDDGRAILGIERFNVRYSKGNWVTDWSQTEFDSCASSGGCRAAPTKRDEIDSADRSSNSISNNGHSGSGSSHGNVGGNKQCISKPEATSFIKDWIKVWEHNFPGWETVVRKTATPDFHLTSGSVRTLHGEPVYGDGNATVFANREEFLQELRDVIVPAVDIKSEGITVSGCDTIWWEFREQNDGGGAGLGIERLDMRLSEGKWKVYKTHTELDSCAKTGTCTDLGNQKRDEIDSTERSSNRNGHGSGHGNGSGNKKCISKSQATDLIIDDFAQVWFRLDNWEAVALRILTPDAQFYSGAARSLFGLTASYEPALDLPDRAAWIRNLKDYAPPTGLQSDDLVLGADGDCNTVFWQFRGSRSGAVTLFLQRFDVRFEQGRWRIYRSDAEFDSCAFIGGANCAPATLTEGASSD